MFDLLTIATTILIVTFIIIALDMLDKAVIAIIAGSLMVILKIISQDEAFRYIDFNVIFLLVGMMIIVNITEKTGVFHWLAVNIVRISKGNPTKIFFLFGFITAILSAFLDNVTTVLLMTPITIVVAKELDINPIPFLITEIFASNIGGTATLIGDPPNIMIGCAAKYDFLKFLAKLSPVIVVILLINMGILYRLFKRDLTVTKEKLGLLVKLNNYGLIKDKKLLIYSLIILGMVLIGFIFHGMLGYEASTIAIVGASLLLLFSPPKDIINELEWSTIFFFIGLFILVGGVQKVGLIDLMANKTLELTSGNIHLTTYTILWSSGILSGVIDNIPYTATMIPLIKQLGTHINTEPLWWALSLGACLGGNFTIIGASANVIVVNFAKSYGYNISFIGFMKYGILITTTSLIISTLYLFIFFL